MSFVLHRTSLFDDFHLESEEPVYKVSGGCQSQNNELPPVKPKVDVDSLINKIETELSWSMYDDWGNTTSLHDGLVDIIREWAESEETK